MTRPRPFSGNGNGPQRLDDQRPARAGHPHAISLDGAVQLTAILVLKDEGFEGGAECDGHDNTPTLTDEPKRVSDGDGGSGAPACTSGRKGWGA